ncbi:hypothetical protein C0585_06945 [Candidatus Woesearchaeota archaeon]|nr:MAG: hypothetical protein C0585_06945 [Candidatus Woesearchaeota archaeon]
MNKQYTLEEVIGLMSGNFYNFHMKLGPNAFLFFHKEKKEQVGTVNLYAETTPGAMISLDPSQESIISILDNYCDDYSIIDGEDSPEILFPEDPLVIDLINHRTRFLRYSDKNFDDEFKAIMMGDLKQAQKYMQNYVCSFYESLPSEVPSKEMHLNFKVQNWLNNLKTLNKASTRNRLRFYELSHYKVGWNLTKIFTENLVKGFKEDIELHNNSTPHFAKRIETLNEFYEDINHLSTQVSDRVDKLYDYTKEFMDLLSIKAYNDLDHVSDSFKNKIVMNSQIYEDQPI